MMKKTLTFIIFGIITLVPSLSLAFSLGASTFSDIIFEILGIIKSLLPILVGLAFVFFFWGLSKFILNSNKPEEIKNGKSYMIGGILALFVLLTFGAIITMIAKELDIDDPNQILIKNQDPKQNNILLPEK